MRDSRKTPQSRKETRDKRRWESRKDLLWMDFGSSSVFASRISGRLLRLRFLDSCQSDRQRNHLSQNTCFRFFGWLQLRHSLPSTIG